MKNYDNEELKRILRERLDDYRYTHSLGVAKAAESLAERYGVDKQKAYRTGLVHDITKNTDKNEQLQIIKKGGIILNPEEKNNPKLWHAVSGSVLVSQLGFDEESVGAVRYHTTGKDNMSVLEKIIYVADFISEERHFDGVDFMRELAFEDLDKACLFALDFCIPNLVKTRNVLHGDSVRLYNELIIKGTTYEEKGKNRNES